MGAAVGCRPRDGGSSRRASRCREMMCTCSVCCRRVGHAFNVYSLTLHEAAGRFDGWRDQEADPNESSRDRRMQVAVLASPILAHDLSIRSALPTCFRQTGRRTRHFHNCVTAPFPNKDRARFSPPSSVSSSFPPTLIIHTRILVLQRSFLLSLPLTLLLVFLFMRSKEQPPHRAWGTRFDALNSSSPSPSSDSSPQRQPMRESLPDGAEAPDFALAKARPVEDRASSGPSIFIGSLPTDIDHRELHHHLSVHLSAHATIKSIKTSCDSKGGVCAFVQCNDPEFTLRSLRSSAELFMGRRLRYEPARVQRSLLMSYRTPYRCDPSSSHLEKLEPATAMILYWKEPGAKCLSVAYNAEACQIESTLRSSVVSPASDARNGFEARRGLFLSPLRYDAETMHRIVRAFGGVESFSPPWDTAYTDNPGPDEYPHPHNVERSDGMEIGCWEVKFEHREHCVEAFRVLRNVPHLNVTWLPPPHVLYRSQRGQRPRTPITACLDRPHPDSRNADIVNNFQRRYTESGEQYVPNHLRTSTHVSSISMDAADFNTTAGTVGSSPSSRATSSGSPDSKTATGKSSAEATVLARQSIDRDWTVVQPPPTHLSFQPIQLESPSPKCGFPSPSALPPSLSRTIGNTPVESIGDTDGDEEPSPPGRESISLKSPLVYGSPTNWGDEMVEEDLRRAKQLQGPSVSQHLSNTCSATFPCTIGEALRNLVHADSPDQNLDCGELLPHVTTEDVAESVPSAEQVGSSLPASPSPPLGPPIKTFHPDVEKAMPIRSQDSGSDMELGGSHEDMPAADDVPPTPGSPEFVFPHINSHTAWNPVDPPAAPERRYSTADRSPVADYNDSRGRRYDPHTLFVGGLDPHGWSEDTIRTVFERYGRIVDLKFKRQDERKAAFAFVTFNSVEAAEHARIDQHNRVYDGREIRVQYREPNTRQPSWKSNVRGRGGRQTGHRQHSRPEFRYASGEGDTRSPFTVSVPGVQSIDLRSGLHTGESTIPSHPFPSRISPDGVIPLHHLRGPAVSPTTYSPVPNAPYYCGQPWYPLGYPFPAPYGHGYPAAYAAVAPGQPNSEAGAATPYGAYHQYSPYPPVLPMRSMSEQPSVPSQPAQPDALDARPPLQPMRYVEGEQGLVAVYAPDALEEYMSGKHQNQTDVPQGSASTHGAAKSWPQYPYPPFYSVSGTSGPFPPIYPPSAHEIGFGPPATFQAPPSPMLPPHMAHPMPAMLAASSNSTSPGQNILRHAPNFQQPERSHGPSKRHPRREYNHYTQDHPHRGHANIPGSMSTRTHIASRAVMQGHIAPVSMQNVADYSPADGIELYRSSDSSVGRPLRPSTSSPALLQVATSQEGHN
ncbi:hypothetical protein BV25DRAFT_1818550 [Artomyces pyxidatus]|uniref:Uncharacterized protein n=1 Tax=Artomyces pyxidatus TaxID=48021 RepID=A0ACB8TID8_9AGAM|nr:hypothetical protein BV25DRAFT_1818550 [Artomyces pyxidatus]